MSPLPAADTSSQTATRPSAPADDPTGGGRAQGAKAKPRPRARSREQARKASAATSIDHALGASMRQFTTRASEDVLALLRERAEDIAAALPAELRGGGPGGALRMVVTDALVHALQLDLEEHVGRVRETRSRELLAQAQAKIG